MIEIKKLTLLEKNPRKISKDQFEKLCRSLEKDPDFFTKRPCLVNVSENKYNVYAGNQRIRAAKKLGWKEVPCIVEENLSDELIKERIIKDNAHYGDWDYDLLANEWEPIDLLQCGFTEEQLLGATKEIENIAETLADDEEEIEIGEESSAVTKLGDLYELGDHLLICGDSSNADYVGRVLDGKEVVLIVTDPPYNLASENNLVAAGSNNKMAQKLKDSSWDKNFDVMQFLNNIQNFLPENISVYIFTSHHLAGKIWDWMKDWSNHYNWCVWKKNNPMPSLMKRHWTWDAELICYATRGKHVFNFPPEGHAHSTFEFSKVNSCDLHPTMKPIPVIEHILTHSSNRKDFIFDPFLGSGTTLIAAERLGRKCIGIELSPAYCDVIVKRYINFVGKQGLNAIIRRNGTIISHEKFI